MPSSTDDTTLEVPLEEKPAGRWIEGLSADLPVLAALEIAYGERWRGVRLRLKDAVESDPAEVEPLHKLRVASRRLSAVLTILTGECPETIHKRLPRRVEKLRRLCGDARNLDVRRRFLESLLPHASVEDAAAIELLCERVVKRRARAQKRLVRKLPDVEKRLTRAADEVLPAIAAVQAEAAPAGTSRESFGQAAGRLLLRELTRLWAAAGTDVDRAAWHPLRIACKRLRYMAEVFMPTLPEAFGTDYYRQIEHMQDLLGEYRDAQKGTRTLGRLRKRWRRRLRNGRGGKRRLAGLQWRELCAGIDAVLLAYTHQADQSRAEFLDLWPGFAGESFRVPVEELLTRLAAPSSSGDER